MAFAVHLAYRQMVEASKGLPGADAVGEAITLLAVVVNAYSFLFAHVLSRFARHGMMIVRSGEHYEYVGKVGG